MHIHILGISGTFMSALAILAKDKGFRVTGHDAACYPPISDLLSNHGIDYIEGYDDASVMLQADEVIVGNAMTRGMPIIETMLNHRKPYISGPAWLAREVLKDYQVIAVSGTHGKTSVTTMLAFILEQAGLEPGYLIGGVPQCLDSNAKCGKGSYFVIEADEYDTAFFDKRPKFMHYRPHGLIFHNLEFDHADIYPNLAAIQQQFHYLFRTVPQNGWVVRPAHDEGVDGAVEKGIYTPAFCWSWENSSDAQIEWIHADGTAFVVKTHFGEAKVQWSLMGQHNVENAVAAILASHKVGVPLQQAANILKNYRPVKRRMEICFHHPDLTVYDDFAHHPTAIRRTSLAIRSSKKHQRVIGILDFASNSMRAGHHLDKMPAALAAVDILYALNTYDFDMQQQAMHWPCQVQVFSNVEELLQHLLAHLEPKDAILMMSNKGFARLRYQLLELLSKDFSVSQA